MFWGLVLEPGKRYSTQVEKSFHVSMAALDCSTVKNNNEILKVLVHIGDTENLLCNLSKDKGILQVKLDLNFLVGDDITFECRGTGNVYLSGYLIADDLEMDGDEDMMEEELEESEEEDASAILNTKANKAQKRKSDLPQPQQNKKKKELEVNSESSEELDDEDMDSSEGEDDDGLEEDDEESEEEVDEEIEEEEDDEEEASSDEEQTERLQAQKKTPETLTKQQKKQQQKQQKQQQKQQQASPQNKQTPGKQNKPVVNGVTPNQQQSGKKDKKKGQTPQTQSPGQNDASTPKQKGNEDPAFKKRVIEGGVVVKDVKLGGGQPVKNGNMVAVYYTGRIKSNNKVFDQVNKGEGFKFKLGKGEVIKGWDIGVNGMKVGGKRVITCPANVAYGKKGSLPTIPPNATLIFEVEMKAVN